MAKRASKDVKALSLRAFELMNSGLSFEETAAQLQVSSRTIRRWVSQCKDVDILPDELDEDDYVDSTETSANLPEFALKGRDVDQLIPLSLKVLQEILEDPDARPSDKLRAIGLVGDWAGLSAGFYGSIRRVIEAGLEVVDPNFPLEPAEGQTIKGLTDEGANLIRAKLLGIVD